MPDSTSKPPGETRASRAVAIEQSTPASMLATTAAKRPGTASIGDVPADRRSATPFRSAFSRVTATASGSTSMHCAPEAPSARAARARTPLPQPTSSRRCPAKTAACSSSTSATSDVVSWRPVPKARPGSSTTTCSPGAAEYVSQGGRTTMLLHKRNGLKNFFHSSRQASLTISSCRGAQSERSPRSASAAEAGSGKLATRVTLPLVPLRSVVPSRSSTPCAPSSNRQPTASSASGGSTSTTTSAKRGGVGSVNGAPPARYWPTLTVTVALEGGGGGGGGPPPPPPLDPLKTPARKRLPMIAPATRTPPPMATGKIQPLLASGTGIRSGAEASPRETTGRLPLSKPC